MKRDLENNNYIFVFLVCGTDSHHASSESSTQKAHSVTNSLIRIVQPSKQQKCNYCGKKVKNWLRFGKWVSDRWERGAGIVLKRPLPSLACEALSKPS